MYGVMDAEKRCVIGAGRRVESYQLRGVVRRLGSYGRRECLYFSGAGWLRQYVMGAGRKAQGAEIWYAAASQ